MIFFTVIANEEVKGMWDILVKGKIIKKKDDLIYYG